LSLGIETTAEGIETADDAAWLAGRGCSLGQGFFYAKPMSMLAALSLFQKYLDKDEAADAEVKRSA
jgi:EAL domain-containing protein (putative c-di-GMP-specific phosphodiesterase class I)